MKELAHFKDSGNPDITVALAGISRIDWKALETNASIQEVCELMKTARFDIIPALDNRGMPVSYYTTKEWGKYHPDEILFKLICAEDRLYYRTLIADVIKQFHLTDRKFFFLDNHFEVIGLLTIGNLNCKHVYLYLYDIVTQLEHTMAEFIYKSGITDDEIIYTFKYRTESENAMEALKRYSEDQIGGYDFDFLEYLYITDLSYIFRKFSLSKRIGYSSTDFKNMLSKINDLRNTVAHPNRSLIRDSNSIHILWETLECVEILMESLK